MPKDKFPNRRSIRLSEYDYRSDGAYFITICVEQKQCLLGYIDAGKMIVNELGKIVEEEWLKSFAIREEILQDEYVIMPNHFHAIVWINREGESDNDKLSSGGLPSAPTKLQPKPKSLSTLIAGFKGASTRRINHKRDTSGARFWQRNYHEHIIRKDANLNKIRYYIRMNPENWAIDSLFVTS